MRSRSRDAKSTSDTDDSLPPLIQDQVPGGTSVASSGDELPPLMCGGTGRRPEQHLSSDDEELPPLMPQSPVPSRSTTSASGITGRDSRVLEPGNSLKQSLAEQPRAQPSAVALPASVSEQPHNVLEKAKSRVASRRRAGDKSEVASALLELAETHLDLEQPEEARQCALEARGIYKEFFNGRGEAEALRVVAKMHWRSNRHAEAMCLAEKELEFFRRQGDRKAEALMWLAICDVHMAQYRFVNAYQAAEWALARSREADDLMSESAALQEVVGVYFAMHRFAKAIRCSPEALEKLELAGNKTGQASLLRMLSEAHCKKDKAEPEQAYRVAHKALVISREVGDRRGEAAALLCVSEANLRRPDGDDPFQTAKEARTISRDLSDKHGEASAWRILARCHEVKGQPDEALDALGRALGLARELEDRRLMSEVLGSIIDTFFATGVPRKAMNIALDEAQRARRANVPQREALALQQVAKVELMRGNPEEAIHQAETALELLQQVGEDKAGEADVHQFIAEIHLGAQRFADAMDSAKEAEALFKSICETRGLVRILQVQVSLYLDTEQYDLAIQAAQQQRRVFRDAGYKEDEASALLGVADLLTQLKGPKDALKVAKEARQLYKDFVDSRGEVVALLTISNLQANSQAESDAVRSAKEALAISKSLGDISLQALSLQAEAQICLVQSSFEEAVRMANKAVELCREGGDIHQEAEQLKRTADVHMQIVHYHERNGLRPNPKNLDDALSVSKSALGLFEGLRDQAGQAAAHLLLASIYVARHEGEKALGAASISLEITTGMDDAHGVGSAHHSLAKAHLIMGQAEEAGKSAKEAQLMFQRIGDDHSLRSCSEIIAKAQEQSQRGRLHRGQNVARSLGRGGRTVLEDRQAPGRQSIPVGESNCGVLAFGFGATRAASAAPSRDLRSDPPQPPHVTRRGPQKGSVADTSGRLPAQATGRQEVGFGRGPGQQLGWGRTRGRPMGLGFSENQAFDDTGVKVDSEHQQELFRPPHRSWGPHASTDLPRRSVREVDGLD